MAEVADICGALPAPETYRLLVDDRGWSHRQWEDWAADCLTRQLLPD